ncbi:MAG: hypothetical protein PHF61_02365 [Bacteroidales bacterium]|nr:hypothetical protein [Bacteroidales bacterium]MDD4430236.1 hypothetical protein [Bacteroidales bacterium]
MTEEQQSLLIQFEARVRQAVVLCKTLREENKTLKEALLHKEMSYLSIQEELRDISQKYDRLKMVKMMSAQDEDLKATRQRLSKLVREINTCIALVNES